MIERYRILVDDKENEEMLWHPYMEIAFVLNGHGILFLDGKKYEIEEEDIFVINSYQIHRVELTEGSHLLSVLISPRFVEQLFPQAADYHYDCKSFLCPEQKMPMIVAVKSRMAEMVSVWSKSREEFSELHMNIQLAHLIACLAENFGEKKEKTDKKEEHWLDLVRYINESYQENITLQMLAKREFMSQSYFSRMFQKEMGVTFTEYITEIRLSHALNLLAKKELTVTDICFETGFRNINSFIESFKQKYGKTPGQYRKEMQQQTVQQKVICLEDGMKFSALFAPLMKYLQKAEEKQVDKTETEVQTVTVYTNQVKEKVKPAWKELLNVGYAKDLLNAQVQAQIRRAAQEVGFRYVRFHGILDDDMVFYREREDGTPILNYSYIDQVLDFVLEQKMRPYIEFGYMPAALAENENCSPFLRCSVISFPKDMDRWRELVCSLIQHWETRYGRREVKGWIFSPLFHGEMLFFYQEQQWERYLEWYEATWKSIKECDMEYQIASPPCMAQGTEGVERFLAWCQKQQCMPEMLSLICFHTADSEEESERNLQLIDKEDAFPMAVSRNQNYLMVFKKKIEPILERYHMDSNQVILAEWNSNVWQRDLVNDTCYKSAFFFKNILENLQNYRAFGYWTLSDFMEEIPPSEDLFHGGFGLFTTNGIPKSSYQALCLLNQMGDTIVARGEGWFVTKQRDEIQIFLYNYCHYEALYRYRHATNLSRTERYQVFCKEPEKRFCMHIQGIAKGMYRVMHYRITREHGSAYDAWVQMGAPASVDTYERGYLEQHSYPEYRTEISFCEQEMKIEENLKPHEVMLIKIKKID